MDVTITSDQTKNIIYLATDENDYVKFENNKVDDNKLNNIIGDEVAYITLTFKALDEEEAVKLPLGTKLTEESVKKVQAAIDAIRYDKTVLEQAEVDKMATDIESALATLEEIKVENPDTSDINVVALIVMMILGTIGFGYTVKKTFN